MRRSPTRSRHRARAAQQRLDAREQLHHLERLGLIVGAEFDRCCGAADLRAETRRLEEDEEREETD
jgi:hypothetical protein